MLAGGRGPPKVGRVAMVATMAASRGATGLDAWSDLGLGTVGIRGQRTGLREGALWETAGVLQSQTQPAGRALLAELEASVGPGTGGLAVWKSPPAGSERPPGLREVG